MSHKIVIVGHGIIDSWLLPIGELSEEAQESCKKYIKKCRQDFSRKCDRTKNVEDVYRKFSERLDTLISSSQKLAPKKLSSLYPHTRLNYSFHLQLRTRVRFFSIIRVTNLKMRTMIFQILLQIDRMGSKTLENDLELNTELW